MTYRRSAHGRAPAVEAGLTGGHRPGGAGGRCPRRPGGCGVGAGPAGAAASLTRRHVGIQHTRDESSGNWCLSAVTVAPMAGAGGGGRRARPPAVAWRLFEQGRPARLPRPVGGLPPWPGARPGGRAAAWLEPASVGSGLGGRHGRTGRRPAGRPRLRRPRPDGPDRSVAVVLSRCLLAATVAAAAMVLVGLSWCRPLPWPGVRRRCRCDAARRTGKPSPADHHRSRQPPTGLSGCRCYRAGAITASAHRRAHVTSSRRCLQISEPAGARALVHCITQRQPAAAPGIRAAGTSWQDPTMRDPRPRVPRRPRPGTRSRLQDLSRRRGVAPPGRTDGPLDPSARTRPIQPRQTEASGHLVLTAWAGAGGRSASVLPRPGQLQPGF